MTDHYKATPDVERWKGTYKIYENALTEQFKIYIILYMFV